MKVCSKCKFNKELTEFHKDLTCKFDVSSKCKTCKKKYSRDYYEKNKESMLFKSKIRQKSEIGKDGKKRYYYSAKGQATIAKYKKENKDKLFLSKKKWRDNNKDKLIKQRLQNRDLKYKYDVEYNRINKDRLNLMRRQWVNNNRDRYNAKSNKHKIKCRRELSDSYLKTLICAKSNLKHKDIPIELVEFKRIQLKISREIRSSKQ